MKANRKATQAQVNTECLFCGNYIAYGLAESGVKLCRACDGIEKPNKRKKYTATLLTKFKYQPLSLNKEWFYSVEVREKTTCRLIGGVRATLKHVKAFAKAYNAPLDMRKSKKGK